MLPAKSENLAVRQAHAPLWGVALSLAAILSGRADLPDTTGSPSPAAAEISTTAVTPPEMGVKPAATAHVPLRGAPPAALPVEPAGLTTELAPQSPSTPLMPEGAESMPADLPTVQTKKRWALTLEARAIYDDNIFLGRPGTEQDDFVFLLTPTVLYRGGDTLTKQGSYFTAGYSASGSAFVDHSKENSVDHSVRLDGQKRLGNLTVGVDGKYQRLSGATVELSDRVDRDEYGARVRARYDISSRTGVEASGGWNGVHYREGALEDYDEWAADLYAGYQATGRTRIAAGGVVGRLDVQGRERQDFTRAMVKVTTNATGKVTLDAKGGMEWRDTGAGKQETPVYNVTAEYRPTSRTSISGSVYRDVTASASVADENYTRTGVAVRVQQKFGRAVTGGIEAGYEQLKYEVSEAGEAGSGREDEYFFIRPSLRYELREGRRLELYYSHREDDSSVNLYDFDADQFGLACAFDF